MLSMPRQWSWAGATRARRAYAATRGPRPSTAPISATPTATSSPPSASDRPTDRCASLMEAIVILNRHKGDPKVVAAALANAGIQADVEAVDGDDIERRAGEAIARGARLVIVGGGDGSVSRAA